jgi:hypothetical protein
MKASSESGLWALTISWGATVVIRGTLSLHYRKVEACEWEGREREKIEKKKVKGRSSDWVVNWKQLLAIIDFAHTTHCPNLSGTR